MTYAVSARPRRRDDSLRGLFFNSAITIFLALPRFRLISLMPLLLRVCDALFFHIGKPCAIAVFPLKTLAAGLATIPLRPIFTLPIFDEIVALTNGTFDLNILFHNTLWLNIDDIEISYDHI